MVYGIPCKSCDRVCVGETDRKFGTRFNEHKKDCEQNKKQQYTRSERQKSESEYNKSAKLQTTSIVLTIS